MSAVALLLIADPSFSGWFAFDVVLVVIMAALVVRALWLAIRRRPAADDPRRPPPHRDLQVISLLVLLAGLVIAVLVAINDAQATELPAGLIAGAGQVALIAIALAVEQFAVPRLVRSSERQYFGVLLLALAFAVGGCYGLLCLA